MMQDQVSHDLAGLFRSSRRSQPEEPAGGASRRSQPEVLTSDTSRASPLIICRALARSSPSERWSLSFFVESGCLHAVAWGLMVVLLARRDRGYVSG